jgi:transposase
MRHLSKSPLAVAREALAVGEAVLPLYSSPYSPKTYTQAQLFSVLVVRRMLKLDYRGVAELLAEFSDLRKLLKLKKIPHFTSLCQAEHRLMRNGGFDVLLEQTIRRCCRWGWITKPSEASIDSSGMESHHVSRYFVHRKGSRQDWYRPWLKLTIVILNQLHLILAALVDSGPSNDAPQFDPAIRQAVSHLPLDVVLADSGYDAERHHALCRQELGISQTAIALNLRGGQTVHGKYRRQMHRRFPKRRFGQRWQIESTFSQHKRVLGDALTARTDEYRQAECLFRVLVHNIMILWLHLNTKVFYRALSPLSLLCRKP